MHKQPGPDKVIMELFKLVNHVNKSWFLSLLNPWWDSKLPLMQAVPIYKKGDTDEPSNYRPVSLLNSSLDFT